jgi:hypothetical protein
MEGSFFLPFQDINVIHIKMKCKPEGIIIKKKQMQCLISKVRIMVVL